MTDDPTARRRPTTWRRVLTSATTLGALSTAPNALAEAPTILEVRTSDPSRDATETGASRGLGFLVANDGFALTTYRNLLVEGTSRLHASVELVPRGATGGRPRRARLVGVEPTLDLAILQLESETRPPRWIATDLDVQTGIAVGDEIYAPSSLGSHQVALGRLTGLNSKECYQESLTSTMYRAEIALPEAVAGAPVYTRDGDVVAIHTAWVPESAADHEDDEEEMHLLPIALVRNIFDSLREKKSMRSPWTGFSVRALSPREALRFPTPQGFDGGIVVEGVWPASPAEKMGIREGDVLVQLGHNRTKSVADFQKWLYLYGVGESVELVILRGEDELLTTEYEIEERPDWAKPR